MAETRFDSAPAFRAALALRVPAKIRSLSGRVYFDSVTQLHEELVRTTRVDTGYLRASLGASAEGAGSSAVVLDASDRSRRRPGEFLSAANEAAAITGMQLAQAARIFAPVTMGYTARYAPNVEDRFHTMKQAVSKWRVFNTRAIANAREHAAATETPA